MTPPPPGEGRLDRGGGGAGHGVGMQIDIGYVLASIPHPLRKQVAGGASTGFPSLSSHSQLSPSGQL